MADHVSFIIDYFNEALALEQQGRMADAARMYRIAEVYYQSGDFWEPPSAEVQACESKIERCYNHCLQRLSATERKAIRMEYNSWFHVTAKGPSDWSSAFLGDWRGFIGAQYQKIYPQQ